MLPGELIIAALVLIVPKWAILILKHWLYSMFSSTHIQNSELKWKQVYTCNICMLQTWHWSVKNRRSPHVCAQVWTLRPMGPMLLLWQGRTKENPSSPWRYVVKKSAWQTGQNGVCVFFKPGNGWIFGISKAPKFWDTENFCWMFVDSMMFHDEGQCFWLTSSRPFFPLAYLGACEMNALCKASDHSKNQGLRVMWFSRE